MRQQMRAMLRPAAMLAGAAMFAVASFASMGLAGSHSAVGSPASPSLIPVAVFGSDDRVPPPAEYETAVQGLGLLLNTRARAACTAFCVADAVIATAAHCLYRPTGRIAPRLADFWFARGFDRTRDLSRIHGHDRGAAAQSVIAGTERVSIDPPITATGDWALVRLARPLCQGRALSVVPMSRDALAAAAEARQFVQLSYHRDFAPWRPAYSKPCPLWKPADGDTRAALAEFDRPEHLILHTCDTGGASSGSPLLVADAGGLRVVGINVGTYVQARSLMRSGEVVHRLEPETVANTGIAAITFADRIGPLAGAAILTSREAIGRLQSALAARGRYTGPRDGTFSASLRAAIERYESAERLPVTGIASEALARRLGATR